MTEFHYNIEKDSRDFLNSQEMYRVVLANLNLNESDKLLDIGCGAGYFLEKLPQYIDTWGVDINPTFIEARRLDYGHFLAKDFCEDHIFDADFFDVIIAICVLEHVDNPTFLVRESYRICKKGGIAVFVTPNLARPSRLFMATRKKKVFDRSGHKQGWDYHLLHNFLENQGWKVKKIITRFVDCLGYSLLPQSVARYLSYKILLKLFPRTGSELYAFCRK